MDGEVPVRVVQDTVGLEGVLRELAVEREWAFDLETTGLDPIADKIVGVALAYGYEKAIYIPVLHRTGIQLPLQQVLEKLKPLFSDRQSTKIAHNAKFDLRFLVRAGIEEVKPVYDTMLTFQVMDEGQRSPTGLKELSPRYLGVRQDSFAETLGDAETFEDVPIEIAARYAGYDALLTLRLYRKFRVLLGNDPKARKICDLEMSVLPAIVRMEDTGIRIDEPYFAELEQTMGGQMEELKVSIFETVGNPFNINSAKQLAHVLYDQLGLPVVGKTKTGLGKSDAGALQALREEHPVVESILEYRHLQSIRSKFVGPLPTYVHPLTGRIHTSFRQIGARTGRFSSARPNLQQVPKHKSDLIRKGFIPEEGFCFASFDFSQIEIRVLAQVARDEKLIEAFRRGEDIYQATASQLFGKPLEAVTDSERQQCKSIVLGLCYGMGVRRLAKILGLGKEEAKEFIDRFFQTYPALVEFRRGSVEQAEKQRFVESLWGRRRKIAKNRLNSAINSRIQSSAADLMKYAIVRAYSRIRRFGPDIRLLLTIHDELVFEIREDRVEEVLPVIHQAMTDPMPDFDVPIDVDVEVGPNLGQLKEVMIDPEN
jgi:DNA polymerase I